MFQKGKNAIELLSLKPAVHKHMVCSEHATNVDSCSLGRKIIIIINKIKKNQPSLTPDLSFALLTSFVTSLREPSRCACRIFAGGMPTRSGI